MASALIYRIKNWNLLYENSSSRKIRYCSWVPLPIRHDELGYSILITGHKDGAAHYGVWISLVCLCSKQSGRWFDKDAKKWKGSPRQGILTDNGGNDGIPLGVNEIHLITRIPKSIINDALPRLVEIKWLEVIDNKQAPSQVDSETTSIERSRYITEQNRTKGTEQKLTRKGVVGGQKESEIAPRILGDLKFLSGVTIPQPFIDSENKEWALDISKEFYIHQRTEHGNVYPELETEKFNKTVLKGAIELDKLIRLDGETREMVKDVLVFSVKDAFWKTQSYFLSSLRIANKPGDPRTRYQKIKSAMQGAKKSGYISFKELGQEIEDEENEEQY